MIYTLTFNPSLDYIVHVNGFRTGTVNRTTFETIYAGGKGINVSIVLRTLGYESMALGFRAGHTGNMLCDLLKAQDVHSDFIEVREGFTRINVKMKSDDETEINGQGPRITENDIALLKEKLDALTDKDTLVISGSIPNTLPDDMYERILEWLKGRNVRTIVDATGDLLVNVLPYRPFLIKPNNHELGEIFHTTLKTREDVVPYAKKLQEKGARNVLISMAGEGAMLVDEEGNVHMHEAPKGKVLNSVGAGDSMVAGFLAGWMDKRDYEHAFRLGIASGSASAFSQGLADKETITAVFNTIQ